MCDDIMDPALYNIYVDFLNNHFLQTLKNSEKDREDGKSGDFSEETVTMA